MDRFEDQTFSVDRSGSLVMHRTPRRGAAYRHTCSKNAYYRIAIAVDEMTTSGRSFTLRDVVAETRLPYSQANVALSFMKERGVIVRVFKRKFIGASGFACEDAMIEYSALQHTLV